MEGPSWGMAAIAGGGAFWKSRPVGPENGSGGGRTEDSRWISEQELGGWSPHHRPASSYCSAKYEAMHRRLVTIGSLQRRQCDRTQYGLDPS